MGGVLAVLALAAGCSDGRVVDFDAVDTPSTQTFGVVPDGDGGRPAGGGSGGQGQTPPGSPPPGGEPSEGATADGATPAPGGSGATAGGGTDGVAPGDEPPPDDRGRLGAMGAALLGAGVPEAVIEIDASPGRSLTNAARSALRDRLAEHGEKRSVGFAAGSILPERDVWTPSTLRAAADRHRDTWSTRSRAAVYVMVVSGSFEDPDAPDPDGDSTPVGYAFAASSFALFVDQLPDGSLLGLTRGDYERAVAVHELGHLFGLVNLTGRGDFHEDPEHPGHSANRGSVMFWAIEQSGPLRELFEGGPPSTFDADDRAEMERIRAG